MSDYFMDDEDKTPMPEGLDADAWRKADETFHATALVADDAKCVKIIYDFIVAERSKTGEEMVLVPRRMTAAMINAWSGGTTVTSDEVAFHTSFQDAWARVIAAADSTR